MIHRKILKKILSIIFIVSLFANNISGNNFFHKNDNKIKSNNNKNHLLSKFNKRKIWFLACTFTSLSLLLHFFQKNKLIKDITPEEHKEKDVTPEEHKEVVHTLTPEERNFFPGSEGFSPIMFNTELVPAITSEEALNHLKIWQVSYNQLNDPGIDFSGWWKDEAEVRNKPGLFFLQVSEGYWKGLTFVRINNGWFPAGYYELITLQDLNDQLFIFSRHPRTKGRVIIIHGKHACNAVDAIKMKGDEVSLQVVASNFNVIETVNQSNFNKLFKLYCIDRTLGPILMTRNAFASMVLLHVFNCKGVKIFPFPFGSPLNNFIQKTRGQIEFNLLHRFGILTSAGYAVSGLKEDFKEKINDANFAAICVRHSPAVARFKFSKKLLSGEICLNNLFIYASLSTKPGYCKALKNLEPSIQEEHIEANLRRYYKSVLLYAKLNKLETVCAPFLGSGVFGVPFYYHSKILDELGNEILDSGITLIINAFCGYSNKNNSSVHVRNVKWPNYVQLLDVSGFKSFAQVVNEITNHISA